MAVLKTESLTSSREAENQLYLHCRFTRRFGHPQHQIPLQKAEGSKIGQKLIQEVGSSFPCQQCVQLNTRFLYSFQRTEGLISGESKIECTWTGQQSSSELLASADNTNSSQSSLESAFSEQLTDSRTKLKILHRGIKIQ